MRIEEKDFKIEYDGTQFTLFYLKSKKELKEDAKETYKTAGYFMNVYNALKMAIRWREDKKYPFKESPEELKKLLKEYRRADNQLAIAANSIYQPIFEFKRKVFDGVRKI